VHPRQSGAGSRGGCRQRCSGGTKCCRRVLHGARRLGWARRASTPSGATRGCCSGTTGGGRCYRFNGYNFNSDAIGYIFNSDANFNSGSSDFNYSGNIRHRRRRGELGITYASSPCNAT
jgi:hypothetical protein